MSVPAPVPPDDVTNPVEAVERERQRRQRSRNFAVFFCLLGFVVLVYAVTITKIKLGYGP